MSAGLAGRVVSDRWATGGMFLIAAVSVLLTTLQADFRKPPRGDGAGYAVLGASVAEGRGYREIDKLREPRHAHFPPGYPLVLAGVWTVAGRSEVVAHAVSVVATGGSVVLAWLWFRSWCRAKIAFGLALALALNWTWGRLGGDILSEPVYLFWQMMALVVAGWVGRKGGTGKAVLLGLVLGWATLTRYVGVAVAAAVAADLGLRKRYREMLVSGLTASVVLLPWAVWMVSVERPTHLGLLPGGGGLLSTIGTQALFYLQRVPDQIVGPFVEVGTIYRRSVPVLVAVHVWAVVATGLVLAGWVRTLKTKRKRIVGLWGFFTLALLLVWPFTEAGRFLVPLVPALLVGAFEGLSGALGLLERRRVAWPPEKGDRHPAQERFPGKSRFSVGPGASALFPPVCSIQPFGALGFRRQARRAAVAVLVAVSVPYSVHSVRSHQGWTPGPFDQACRWLSDGHLPGGAVLTTRPAEVFWESGRKACSPGELDLDDPESVRRLGIGFVLVESGPADGPLRRILKALPIRLRKTVSDGTRPEARVYEPLESISSRTPGDP